MTLYGMLLVGSKGGSVKPCVSLQLSTYQARKGSLYLSSSSSLEKEDIVCEDCRPLASLTYMIPEGLLRGPSSLWRKPILTSYDSLDWAAMSGIGHRNLTAHVRPTMIGEPSCNTVPVRARKWILEHIRMQRGLGAIVDEGRVTGKVMAPQQSLQN